MYRKVFTDAEGSFNIEMLENGKWRKVSPEQDLYIQWLESGNVAEEVPYIAPIVKEPLKQWYVGQCMAIALRKRDTTMFGDLEYGGMIIDASANGFSVLILNAEKDSEEAVKKGTDYNVTYPLKDGTLARLDKNEIIEIAKLFRANGKKSHDTFITDMQKIRNTSTTKAQLKAYYESGGTWE